MISVIGLLQSTIGSPDTGQVFSWIISGIGVVGFLAAAAQFLRGSADKGTITSLQNSVSALETAGDIKDEKIADLEAQVNTLSTELHVWRNAVTAKEELATLTETQRVQHTETMGILLDIQGKVARA